MSCLCWLSLFCLHSFCLLQLDFIPLHYRKWSMSLIRKSCENQIFPHLIELSAKPDTVPTSTSGSTVSSSFPFVCILAFSSCLDECSFKSFFRFLFPYQIPKFCSNLGLCSHFKLLFRKYYLLLWFWRPISRLMNLQFMSLTLTSSLQSRHMLRYHLGLST